MSEAGAGSNGRKVLLAMFAIAFATIGSAYLLFYFAQSGEVWGTTNNGEFVDPPMHAESLGLVDFAGVPLRSQEKWQLWYVVDACQTDCVERLEALRSLHILLNRDAKRLERALVARVGDPTLEAEFPQLRQLRKPAMLATGIYIVDPIGNLVLRYTEDSAPKPILEDLKKLLKLSQIG